MLFYGCRRFDFNQPYVVGFIPIEDVRTNEDPVGIKRRLKQRHCCLLQAYLRFHEGLAEIVVMADEMPFRPQSLRGGAHFVADREYGLRSTTNFGEFRKIRLQPQPLDALSACHHA